MIPLMTSSRPEQHSTSKYKGCKALLPCFWPGPEEGFLNRPGD